MTIEEARALGCREISRLREQLLGAGFVRRAAVPQRAAIRGRVAIVGRIAIVARSPRARRRVRRLVRRRDQSFRSRVARGTAMRERIASFSPPC
jgi:hypothetical protein